LAASYHHLTQGAYRSGIGEWQAAQRELERSLDLALEMKFSRRVGDATAMLGVLAYHRGEFDDAHDCATRLLDDDDPGDVQLAFRGRLGRAQVSAARGQFDEVLDELGHVSNMSEVVGIPDRIWAYGLLALAYAALSRHRDAQRAAQQALFEAGKGAPSAHHAVAGYGATADALLKLWEAEKRRAGAQAPTTRERRQACQRAVRALATCGRVYPIARPSLAFARGRCDEVLDRPTRARDHWLSGLRTAETLGMPYEQARLHLALSKLADGGAESTRRTSGERARELCTRLGIEMASL
jgi:tetratricopeptide (TPR) repeat protein